MYMSYIVTLVYLCEGHGEEYTLVPDVTIRPWDEGRKCA